MEPVSRTAFYCCGIRMADAESASPVCGDHLARRLMDERGLEVFRPFARFSAPNGSNVTRHRIIDDLLREALRPDPERLVVLVGAGFDTRAYRLGAGRWVELDEPAVIAHKNERLPVAECPRPLERVAIEFARQPIEAALARHAGTTGAVVVIEGVIMYLDGAALRATLASLLRLFPAHRLICDLMTRRFFERYSRSIHREIAGLGASFQGLRDDPAAPIEALGYRSVGSLSIVGRARELGAVRVPRLLLATVLRSLASGYRVHQFDAPGGAPAGTG